MNSKEKRTELSEIGEFGLIQKISDSVKLINKSSLKGIGDDAAVIKYEVNKQTLISTDMLVEGVHFDLTYCPLKHLGYKSAVVNFSDIYAMNGTPRQLTVSLAVSNRFSLEAIDEFYAGLMLACEAYGVDIIGGDTTSSLAGFVVSITVVGEAESDEIVYRNGAGENDLICVSGDLGAAYLGLQILEREKNIYKEDPSIQPDLSGHDYIIGRQLKPEARKDIIEKLKEAGVKPTSMIDVSDGLASEIIHICKQSDKGCAIYEEKIPVNSETRYEAENLKLSEITCALNGGEDYELLFTIAQKDYEKVKNIVSVIGHITHSSAGMNLITKAGAQVEITAQGWDALLNRKQA
jgi:thiamine-monophosphate kinase